MLLGGRDVIREAETGSGMAAAEDEANGATRPARGGDRLDRAPFQGRWSAW